MKYAPPKIGKDFPTMDDYVALELEVTRRTAPERATATHNEVTFEERIDRSEQYARWRYREFLSGNVARL